MIQCSCKRLNNEKLPRAPKRQFMITFGVAYKQKTWSQSAYSFHSVKTLASPDLSRLATLKAPRQCKYIDSTYRPERQKRPKPIRTVYNTLHETSRCLVLDQQLRVCEVLTLSKPSVQLRLHYVCVARLSPLGAFSVRYGKVMENISIGKYFP